MRNTKKTTLGFYVLTIIMGNFSPNFVRAAAGGYRLFPSLGCDDATALTCYTNEVFRFAQVAILTLAIAGFVVAGIIYMTSAGNPKQIEMAKKIIIGALSAIATIVLGRFFLTKIIGVQLT